MLWFQFQSAARPVLVLLLSRKVVRRLGEIVFLQFLLGLTPKFFVPALRLASLFPKLMRTDSDLFFCRKCHGEPPQCHAPQPYRTCAAPQRRTCGVAKCGVDRLTF